jgi:hypothetical protein
LVETETAHDNLATIASRYGRRVKAVMTLPILRLFRVAALLSTLKAQADTTL